MNKSIDRLRRFVVTATQLADECGPRGMEGAVLLAHFRELVSHDDWLPEACSIPHSDYYQQYLLHCDPLERFSIVSFVWGPGQSTPVHDHAVWGYVGVLRGAEMSQRFDRDGDGMRSQGDPDRIEPGQVDVLRPSEGDVHRVWNAYTDRPSISVHMYGGNIGAIARSVFDPQTGQAKRFVSGYSSEAVPNLWDRSAQVRAQA